MPHTYSKSRLKRTQLLTNRFLSQIGQFCTEINPVNPGKTYKMTSAKQFVITDVECILNSITNPNQKEMNEINVYLQKEPFKNSFYSQQTKF